MEEPVGVSAEKIKPYEQNGSKAEQVREMFDSIAPAYDFMNTAMTFGMHRSWRNKALKAVKKIKAAPGKIIDLATGTGDLAMAMARMFPKAEITGSDLSEGMLAIARKKSAELPDEQAARLRFEEGDCLNLKYADDSFDATTIAYGVRNFENLAGGLAEMQRILRPGGVCMILELSRPENKFVRFFYDLYSGKVIPLMGRLRSKDRRAYSYLPESIAAMPPRREIVKMLKDAGFGRVESRPMTLGVVTLYLAVK